MTRHSRFLSDEQWKKIEPVLPSEKPEFKGGRPRADNGEALGDVLKLDCA